LIDADVSEATPEVDVDAPDSTSEVNRWDV
jgi:hypothetical protein